MTRTLYICYFGLREPLVETQVIPYLRELQRDGIATSLLTFEPSFSQKWTADDIAQKKAELAEWGIDWHCLAYHKSPTMVATAYDVLAGVRYVRKLLATTEFEILHARVHVPALIALVARKLSSQTPKVVFDIRGFVPEEYADAGVWKSGGLLFKLAKRIERWIIRSSDAFVVLTEAARLALFPETSQGGYDHADRPVEVIPCCVDLERRFAGDYDSLREKTRRELNLDKRKVITHLGALGGLYLTPEIVEFLTVAREEDPSVFALFLTQSDPGDITQRLLAAGFDEKDFLVRRVPQGDVPAYLCASDIGLSFVRSSYATISRSPTKIPEYLACGLPIIANRGVGDVDSLINTNALGAIVDDFNSEAYAEALAHVDALGDIRHRATDVAANEFDLERVGGFRYRRLYHRLLHPRRLRKTLYISYFGVREPLVQTQVLPYLREIQKGEYPDIDGEHEIPIKISLLTFERDASLDIGSVQDQMNALGIDWHWLTYHKRVSPIATGWDIVTGTWFVRRFLAKERPDIIHGRVHVPTLMGALARKLSSHKPRLIFDIRGFFPEEYSDAGLWTEKGVIYRIAKRVERWLLEESDGFVVLTQKARRILFPETDTPIPESRGKRGLNGYRDKHGRPLEVIPCCVDFELFSASEGSSRESTRRRLGIEDRRVIIYVGSFGGWYLTDEMVDFFCAAREYDMTTKIMVLTAHDRERVVEKLNAKGFGNRDFLVESVLPENVPAYLCAADVAVAFIMPSFSKKASSPTKHAEYLAAGLPIICNSGIGDVDELVNGRSIGTLIDNFSPESFQAALDEIVRLGDVAETCRQTARSEFDLRAVGGTRYRRLYRRLFENEQ